MKKPTEDIINRVLDNFGTVEETQKTIDWFATVEARDYLDERMDREYAEENNLNGCDDLVFEDKIRKLIDYKTKQKKRRKIAFQVAAVLIPFILVTAFAFYMNAKVDLIGNSKIEVVTTRKQEKLHLVFQDGTEVYINPGSTVSFPKKFGIAERRVALNGEAYFKVAKNASRPFIVDMKETSIKVLGTSFLVKSYEEDDEVNILLEEGCIDFRMQDGKNQILRASQQLRYSKQANSVVIKENRSRENYSNWRNNIIIFNDSKLVDVLKTLNRWYDKRFEIRNEDLKKMTYTTTFFNASLSEILTEIEEVSPIEFSSSGDTIVVSHRR